MVYSDEYYLKIKIQSALIAQKISQRILCNVSVRFYGEIVEFQSEKVSTYTLWHEFLLIEKTIQGLKSTDDLISELSSRLIKHEANEAKARRRTEDLWKRWEQRQLQ